MDAFSYLSVLMSVVLGLAIQQILQGYRAIALARRRVRLYWPTIAWSVLLLAMIAQHWWASFGLAAPREWTFPAFAVILVTAALIYMMAALVLPDVGADGSMDLRDHYWREVPTFFAVGAAAVLSSIVREIILEGRPPLGFNLVFHIIFLAMTLTAIAVRREWLHKLFAGTMVGLFLIYISLLFARLG